jgi:hypothetical protein
MFNLNFDENCLSVFNTQELLDTTIYFSWNAEKDYPLINLILDEEPKFNISLFDYTGYLQKENNKIFYLEKENWSKKCKFYSFKSEGKGDVLEFISDLESNIQTNSYVGIFDDDIIIRVSDLNRAIVIGTNAKMSSFQPSLVRCSHISHEFTVNCSNSIARKVDWVEVTMIILKKNLLQSAKPFFKYSISSWGLDCYVFPILSITEGIGNYHGIIDASIASHVRPLQSDKKIYRNGLTANQEMVEIKKICKEYLTNMNYEWRTHEEIKKLLDFEFV